MENINDGRRNSGIRDAVCRPWAARDGKAFLDLWHPEGSLHTPLVGRGWRATNSTG